MPKDKLRALILSVKMAQSSRVKMLLLALARKELQNTNALPLP